MFSCTIDDQLALVLLQAADAEALYAVLTASRTHLQPWIGWVEAESADDYRVFLQRSLNNFAAGLGFYAGIQCNGAWAGAVGLEIDAWNRVGSVGYWLSEPFQGRGIMTRSLAKVLHLAFVEYGVNRVEMRTASGNVRSCSLAERLGFQKEGELRQGQWLNGHFVDVACYGLLANEWLERGQQLLLGPDHHERPKSPRLAENG